VPHCPGSTGTRPTEGSKQRKQTTKSSRLGQVVGSKKGKSRGVRIARPKKAVRAMMNCRTVQRSTGHCSAIQIFILKIPHRAVPHCPGRAGTSWGKGNVGSTGTRRVREGESGVRREKGSNVGPQRGRHVGLSADRRRGKRRCRRGRMAGKKGREKTGGAVAKYGSGDQLRYVGSEVSAVAHRSPTTV